MPDEEFLKELQLQYARELGIKESLDNKATSLMKISGTTGTLLTGFGIFLLGKLTLQFYYAPVIFHLLIIGITFIILSILFSVLAHVLRSYTYPMGHEEFYDKNDEYLQENVNKFRSSTQEVFHKRMFEEYLYSIRECTRESESKAQNIAFGHWFFFMGVLTIPFLVMLLIYAVLTNSISLSLT